MASKVIYLILFVLLGGCGVYSTQPLTDPKTEEPDEALYGHWVGRLKTDPSHSEFHLFIGKSKGTAGPVAKPFMEGALVQWLGNDATLAVSVQGYFTVSRIGKSSYMNVFHEETHEGKNALAQRDKIQYEHWEKQSRKSVFISRYVVQENRLTVWVPSDKNEKYEGLIKAGELQKVEEFDYNKVVSFDSLFRYLRKNDGGPALFDEAITFTKVPPVK